MRQEALAALLLAATLVAAGCLGGPADDDANAAATDAEDTTGAPEGRGPIVAFEETNQTEDGAGGVDHHHDLWNGRGRVLIFERASMMQPSPNDQNEASATFRPPQGTFIFEATSTVEFTITNPKRHVCEPLVTFGGRFYCTDYLGPDRPAAPAIDDPNPPAGLKLRYKHASTTQWIDAGELTWGTPLAIKITDPVQTDMPHATSSVWQFQVTSPHSQDTTLAFTAKAEIVRGEGDVPLWPGHPLFYTPEKPSRAVVENVAAKACDSGLTGVGCTLAGDGVEPVVPSKLISYGTRTLYVWANITNAQFPNPATEPKVWFLYHRNATGANNVTNIFDEENHGIAQREHLWILPVDDGSMDSPYADGSRWEFELGAAYTPPVGPSCYGGCADWYAEYTLTVIATSDELPPEDYVMYCLDPDVHCGD